MNALRETIWVLGDQLSPLLGPLATADPSRTRILMVESTTKIASRNWHLQRAHLVVSGMRHLAHDLEQRGFHVDYRRAGSLRGGLEAHRTEFGPT
ncbi:MAG: cryptochrome/photolyase family protein, partial [Actinobacteria bacterium]|nr:cryptochrome/photolyase family protein [Actinomycetota bacterium]